MKLVYPHMRCWNLLQFRSAVYSYKLSSWLLRRNWKFWPIKLFSCFGEGRSKRKVSLSCWGSIRLNRPMWTPAELFYCTDYREFLLEASVRCSVNVKSKQIFTTCDIFHNCDKKLRGSSIMIEETHKNWQ